MKHGRLAHVRSQFSLFRRSPTHKNLPPATFCASERVFAVLFARRKKYQKTFPCRELRGFPNIDSAHPNNDHALTKLNPFAALRRLLFPTFCKVQKVGQKNFSACGGVMLLTQHSCRFAAKLKALPCGTARFRQAPMRAYRTHECFCPRRLYNNRCLYRHCSRTNRW